MELTADGVQSAHLVDLGCGVGGSLTSATRRFGVPGFGLEIRQHLVDQGVAAGLPVVQGDICALGPDDLPHLDYAVLDNVLEHLASLDEVERVLASACSVASRLVHVRHPSFEDEDYLEQLGCKLYWTDWKRHRTHVTIADYRAIAARLGVAVLVQPVGRITSSADASVLPLGAPPDQPRLDKTRDGIYDEAKHGPKQHVDFDRDVWFAYDLLFVTGEGIPVVSYPSDPRTSRTRPRIAWAGDPASMAWLRSTDTPDDPVSAPAPLAPPAPGSPSGPQPIEAGDGDQQPALQAEIDAVAAAGGGTVLLGPGRHRLGKTLVVADNVRVEGAGLVATSLAPLHRGIGAVVRLGAGPVEGASVEALTVDGRVLGEPSADIGIDVRDGGSFVIIRNVRVYGIHGVGIVLRGPSIDDVCIERVFIERTGKAGMALRADRARSLFLSEVAIADVGRVQTAPALVVACRCHISQLHVEGVPEGRPGVRFLDGASDSTLSNHAIEVRGGDAVAVPSRGRVHLGAAAVTRSAPG